jgi:hypothetical protein
LKSGHGLQRNVDQAEPFTTPPATAFTPAIAFTANDMQPNALTA